MKQLSKITRTSTRRGRWLRTLGVTAIAALGCYATTASAFKTDVGLEYWSAGFVVDSDAFATGDLGSSDDGFAHYLRLKADFKHEKSGISIHTSVNLLGDRWEGDIHSGGSNPNQHAVTNTGFATGGIQNNPVYIDYAYVQVPLAFGLLRVGRQPSNWNNCILDCKDRRDRILLIAPVGNTTFLAGMDVRTEGLAFSNQDDGHEYLAGFISTFGDWTLGFLYVLLSGEDNGDLQGLAATPTTYVLQGVNIISPYIQGSVGPINLALGFNYLWGGDVSDDSVAAALPDGQILSEESIGGYLRVGADLGMLDLKAQWVTTMDGGYLNAGFDTYSSLINNNPRAQQNPTSVYRMGRYLGLEDAQENLYIANATVNLTEQFSIGASVGFLDVQIPTATGEESDGSMVYDLQASYDVNEALRFWGTVGYLEENEVALTTGNGIIGFRRVPFAEDGILAASVNMGIKF